MKPVARMIQQENNCVYATWYDPQTKRLMTQGKRLRKGAEGPYPGLAKVLCKARLRTAGIVFLKDTFGIPSDEARRVVNNLMDKGAVECQV